MRYKYTVTGGKIIDEGAEVQWDFKGAALGSYSAKVTVTDQRGGRASASTAVRVIECPECDCPCPAILVSCAEAVDEGERVEFSANITGDYPGMKPTYHWSVTAGIILKGQGTPTIEVDTSGLAGQRVKATVELGNFLPECDRTESCEVKVRER